jgi:uncharacterized small protein (DUF1192 family)
MAIFEDGPAKIVRPHEIGQDLSLLSVSELTERIELLQAEIRRLETERASKDATKQAADAMFRLK